MITFLKFLIIAPSSTSVQLNAFPEIIFVGTNPQLTCISTLSLLTSITFYVTMELYGPYGTIKKQASMTSFGKYVGIFSLHNVGDQHAGIYNCSTVVTGPSLIPSIETMSNTIQIITGIVFIINSLI